MEGMEQKITSFFEGAGKDATERLGIGANILITAGNASCTLKMTEERAVKVETDGKDGDMEIRGEQKQMDDLFSSSSMDEYSKKIISYVKDGKQPEVKILLKRTGENSAKFQQLYMSFLNKMVLLK